MDKGVKLTRRATTLELTLKVKSSKATLRAFAESFPPNTVPTTDFVWVAGESAAADALAWLLPFLVGKEEEASTSFSELRAEPESRKPPKEPVSLQETPLEVQRAVALYLEGKSALEVAKELGHNRTTVSAWLRKLGVVRPKAAAILAGRAKRRNLVRNRPDVVEARKLYEAGHSVAEVAVLLGKKPFTVCYWLRSLGVTRPPTHRLHRKNPA